MEIKRQQIDTWRAQTPGCHERVHLNNAGAALPPASVIDAMSAHLSLEARIGGYEAEAEAKSGIADCYTRVGDLIGTSAHNVAIVENATVALAQALSSFDFTPGDRIVTTRLDYPSNQLMYLSLVRRCGVEIVRAEDLPEGGVDPASVARLADHPRCRLVALTWVPTNSGTVQDAHAVGAICESLGIPYIVDACQVVGQLPVDVRSLRCDFLAATGRKFLRGPRGIGFLYVSDRALQRGAYPLYVDMRGAKWIASNDFQLADDARRFENWEFACALVLGLGEAARYALEAGTAAMHRTQGLARALRERLATVGNLELMDRGTETSAIVTVATGRDSSTLVKQLRTLRVNTSASCREDGVIDMDEKQEASVLRLSPHYYNTEAELDVAVAALADLLGD
ncbi:MAG TPA: aminotransferase class V-fold PLP-dependent enzyme [Woeseiaceae bacterium]|nr:aminotransferase class V-fold PLP-dependent enzyme [Woeseiaceae bacterium]